MISGNIITLNEEKNISDCIRSLQTICDEIIVVDSGSTDDTVKIAEELGATVVYQPYLGDGPQKNAALSFIKNKWVISLDADERLTDELINAIKSLDLENTTYDAFAFRRRNMIGSRWIRVCGWYPDYCIRLYNAENVKFLDKKQHSKISTENYQNLDADAIHLSFENVGQLFAKPERNFTTRGAKILYKEGKRANALSPTLHGLTAFIRTYFFKRGFLGGVDGMTVALSIAVNSYLKYAKLLEFQRDPEVLNSENFNDIW